MALDIAGIACFLLIIADAERYDILLYMWNWIINLEDRWLI